MLLLFSKVSQHVARFENVRQLELLEKSIDGLASAVTESIDVSRQELNVFARAVDLNNADKNQGLLDALVGIREGMIWAATANPKGEITSATQSLGVGRNVQEETWYRQARSRGASSNYGVEADVAAGEAFFFSRSVVGEHGSPAGIVVFALDGSWLEKLAADTTARFGVDVVIVDASGNPVEGTGSLTPEVGSALTQILLLQQVTGLKAQVARVGESVLSFRPFFLSNAIPDLNWHIVAVAPSMPLDKSVSDLAQELSTWAGLALVVATLVPIVLVTHFVKPIERLANAAIMTADGRFQFPEERCFTREAAMLSASLARLQTQLGITKKMQDQDRTTLQDSTETRSRTRSPKFRLMRSLSRLS